MWHFDKKVLERIEHGADTIMPLFIPVEIAKECELYQDSGALTYSKADTCTQIVSNKNNKNRGFERALVPTYYNSTSAYQDIEDAKASKEQHDAKISAVTSHARPSREVTSVSNSAATTFSPVARSASSLFGSASDSSNKRRKSNTTKLPEIMATDQWKKLGKKRQLEDLDRFRNELDDYSKAKEDEIEQLRKNQQISDDQVSALQKALATDSKRASEKKMSFKQLQDKSADNQNDLQTQLDVLRQDGSGLNRISL